MALKYYLITNVGSYDLSVVQRYPFHMVLAQVYNKSPSLRRNLDSMKATYRPRIIMDNGAHEDGQIHFDQYIEAILRLRPDVVVLPDLIGWPHGHSRSFSMEFRDKLRALLPPEYIKHIQFVYVPQGSNSGEVLEEFDWALKALSPLRYIIGFGQAYLHWCLSPEDVDSEAPRQKMIEDVLTRRQPPDHRFHILGARWHPELNLALWSPFVGIDSIKPSICAAAGTTYPQRPHLSTLGNRYRLSYLDDKRADPDGLIANINEFISAYSCDPYRLTDPDEYGGIPVI